jgi:hypothetical protein
MIKKYILASLSIHILIITSIIYIIGLITINIYPTSTNFIITIILSILTTLTIICYLNKSNKVYNIGIILTLLFNAITINNIIELNNKYEYINNIATNKYEYKRYEVFVLKKNTSYNELIKLNNKKIGMLYKNNNNVCRLLNQTTKIECIKYSSITEIEKAINNGEIQSFILSKDDIKILKESNLELKKQTRVIYNTKIKDINI